MDRKSKGRTGAPSVRALRMGEAVRHALAEVLARGEVHDPVLADATVSVTEVRMSPDLRHATAFVKPLLGRDEGAVIAALTQHAGRLAGEVARRVNAKFAARLRFVPDESFEAGDAIDRALRRPEVARDLER